MVPKSSHDEDDDFMVDDDSWSEGDADDDGENGLPTRAANISHRQRDWRDMERYREERELRRLMEDDYLHDDEKPRWSRR